MTTVLTRPNGDDVLAGWMTQQRGKTRRLSDAPRNTPTGGLRFAFYGRVSTEDFQDPATARAWQRTAAAELRCRLCGRRMDSHWVNNRPGYRCRHGHTSVKPATAPRLRNVYHRQDSLLADLATTLSRVTTSQEPHHLVEYLRNHAITIVCGYVHWTLSNGNGSTAH